MITIKLAGDTQDNITNIKEWLEWTGFKVMTIEANNEV